MDYHFQFLDWFRKTYPSLEAFYSGYMVLHVNTPLITVRNDGIDQTAKKLLLIIVAEFEQFYQNDEIPY